LSASDGRAPTWRQKLLFLVVIGQLALMSLVWALGALLLRMLLPRRTGGRLGRAFISFMYRHAWATATRFGLMRLDTGALDALGDEPGGLIIAANHPSMLDALIIVARLPRSVCIMKAGLTRNVFLGNGARLAEYIGNDSGHSMVREAVARLRDGNQLVLFPEGTRTVKPPVNPFKPGLTLLAHRAGVPIQTVLIESESPYLTKGWPLLKAPPLPVRLSVRLGRRFAPEADHRAALRGVEAYFAEELTP
jgi:1-acyl-sn-glycerol-3-phosphate acyltransferase